jgi:hypothetical protein
MLRRKPTALTITSEDLASFEEIYARNIAYQKYLKTGEDPQGWFTRSQSQSQTGEVDFAEQQLRNEQLRRERGQGTVDPNDELKPLPGDKARIVRSREERVMGIGRS